MHEPRSPESTLRPLPSVYESDPADPVHGVAASLLTLGTPPARVDPATLDSMEKALRRHVMRIERDDFGGLEMMLATQTHLLNHLFARSVGSFAECPDTGEKRLHGNVALASQKGCRMTVRELAMLRKWRGGLEEKSTGY